MTTENNDEGKVVRITPPKQIVTAVSLLAIAGALLLIAMFFAQVKEYGYIGQEINAQTTISVSGDGEEYAAPDIATVSYSIVHEGKTSAEARKLVDDSMKKVHEFLTASGVAEKDIKNTSYNLYPKYEYVRQAAVCPKVMTMGVTAPAATYPCYGDGKQVLTGYEVTQSVDVKIRKIDDAGTILGGLIDKGATNVSGLTFTLDNEDVIKAKVRKEAIDKAQAKANELASQLGVTLVRIVSFNEGGSYPIYNYARGGAEMKTMAMDSVAPEAANIPVGENKYVSNVTITYEIK